MKYVYIKYYKKKLNIYFISFIVHNPNSILCNPYFSSGEPVQCSC